jgi:hypothetical protein
MELNKFPTQCIHKQQKQNPLRGDFSRFAEGYKRKVDETKRQNELENVIRT